MNILVVAHYQNDGSPSAIFIHDQIKAYRALGHTVHVISPIAFGKEGFTPNARFRSERREIDDIQHYYLRYVSLSRWGTSGFNAGSAIAALKLQLSAVLKDFSPDIIHAHTLGFDSEIGKWLKKKLGVPLVVTTHGSDTFIPFNEGKTKRIKEYSEGIDAIVCVSNLLKKRLVSCEVETSMGVILNGFQVCYADSVQPKDTFSIIQVGSLIERKKVDISIRALALLRETYPGVSLRVIGSGGELRNLQNLCETMNITDRVHFLGTCSNAQVLAAMTPAAFFVMPSINEGFGIVYLEAMASGCITIGTEGEGIADLIVSGENGFLVPPDDPGAIAHVINWCIEHPEEAKVVAERGRQDVLTLTWTKNAEQYIALFKELLNK